MIVAKARSVGLSAMLVGFVWASSASAGLMTTLTAEVSPTSDGFLYEYMLTNDSASDISVVSLSISIDGEADLQSIEGPLGWNPAYMPGDLGIAWESSEASFDLAPGFAAAFSFVSPLEPILSDFLIVGLDEANPRIESNQGQIAGPGPRAIPEPSTMALCALGLAGLFGLARRARRRG